MTNDNRDVVERVAVAIREEQVRQYRDDDDRAKCPSITFYEEHAGPYALATAALKACDHAALEAERDALRAAIIETDRFQRKDLGYSGPDDPELDPHCADDWRQLLAALQPSDTGAGQ